MEKRRRIIDFWTDIGNQNWNNLKTHFTKDALINLNNTNEQFTVDEFIILNSKYPGDWGINTERIETAENTLISVVRVFLEDGTVSLYVTSFYEFEQDKIKLMNEYWGDNGDAPQWRQELDIGKPIK